MATYPGYASVPRNARATVSAANTNRDGTGTIVDVLTGVAAGSRIDKIILQATGTTTAGMLRLFLYDGTNYRLFKEVPVLAKTPSGTAAAWHAVIDTQVDPDLPVLLPSASWKFAASTHNAETFIVHVTYGGDFT